MSERLSLIEKRLTELENREAIRDCVARYGFLADLRLDDAYLTNLTDDVVIDLGDDPAEKWRGRNGAARFVDERMGPRRETMKYRAMHVAAHLVIRTDGDRATAEGYSAVLVLHQGEPCVRMAGFNHWELIRRDGQWRIAMRRRRPLGTGDVPAVMADFTTWAEDLVQVRNEL